MYVAEAFNQHHMMVQNPLSFESKYFPQHDPFAVVRLVLIIYIAWDPKSITFIDIELE
jgi:hypothetical protein